MTLTLQTAPTAEPFELTEAKAFLRVFHTDEDDLIESLIVAARQHAEAYTGRSFIATVWDAKGCSFPCHGEPMWLERAPLLTSPAPVVTYTDTAGVSQTWSSSLYTVDAPAGPWARRGRIFLNYGESYPSVRYIENAVTIRYSAGYGTAATAVPDGIKTAMKMLIAHWYRNREAVVTGTITATIPMAVDAMLWPFKSV